jgi:hypothetical protein
MSDRTTRLLRALSIVEGAGGTLEPAWDPLARDGFAYRGTGSALDDLALAADLEQLADENYLDRVFVDRLSLCPHCTSHALNVREICLTCGSPNLTHMKTILHFRCGYVGPVTAFKEEPNGRRCPKCGKLFDNLGTDHDSPGDYFICRTCNAEFQVPEVGARCLACGAKFGGTDMAKIVTRDVFAYRINALGNAALADGRLRDAPAEVLVDEAGIYRRSVMIAHVEDERKRRLAGGGEFGVIVIGAGTNGTPHALDGTLANAVRATLGVTDRLGRLDRNHLVALLPGAGAARTKAALKKTLQVGGLRARAVEVWDGGDVAERLDEAARLVDAHV